MKRSAAKQKNNSHFNLERINRSSLLALQGSLERLFFFVEVAPRNADSGMREIFARGVWSPRLWNPEYS